MISSYEQRIVETAEAIAAALLKTGVPNVAAIEKIPFEDVKAFLATHDGCNAFLLALQRAIGSYDSVYHVRPAELYELTALNCTRAFVVFRNEPRDHTLEPTTSYVIVGEDGFGHHGPFAAEELAAARAATDAFSRAVDLACARQLVSLQNLIAALAEYPTEDRAILHGIHRACVYQRMFDGLQPNSNEWRQTIADLNQIVSTVADMLGVSLSIELIVE